MTRAARRGLSGTAILALLLGLGWIYQDEILLGLVEVAADRRLPVAANRQAGWYVSTAGA